MAHKGHFSSKFFHFPSNLFHFSSDIFHFSSDGFYFSYKWFFYFSSIFSHDEILVLTGDYRRSGQQNMMIKDKKKIVKNPNSLKSTHLCVKASDTINSLSNSNSQGRFEICSNHKKFQLYELSP